MYSQTKVNDKEGERDPTTATIARNNAIVGGIQTHISQVLSIV